ncbi:MAG: LytTR family DNA-binding domain-containing protein [Oscillospiraceae bacterium]|jgi:DNA-binding LytR/AlgR family response regulator|nr:LytTR family DNA-binding domain-containing protein [Oscillospiraceae bacterium]
MQSPVRIAVCEDLDEDAERLTSLINEIGITADVTRFECGEDILTALTGANADFDLIFLDVYMKNITGIETARLLRAQGVVSRIVFTTTSLDFSLDAFDVEAEQYLVKPIVRNQKLERILTKHLQRTELETCPVSVKGVIVNIPIDDIMYIEAANHNCLVHTPTEVYETGRSMTLSSFDKILRPPRFVHSHRSYIVNLSFVANIDRDFLMKNGDTVYIRRGDVPAIREAYMNWLLAEAAKEQK